VRAYQRVQPLTIGELWQWRSRCASCSSRIFGAWRRSIVRGRAARQEADVLADELLGVGADGASRRRRWASREFESDALITAFAVQLVQRLREQDRAVTPPCAGSINGWRYRGRHPTTSFVSSISGRPR